MPNYLFRAGADVVWRTSNWGEPPLHIEKYLKVEDLKVAYPDADVKLFSDRDIKSVSFRETEHYKITKEILDNPEQMMHYLLGR